MIKPLHILIILMTVYSGARAEEGGELFFENVGVSIHLIDPDSITLQVTASTEDLFNTVSVFPNAGSEKSVFQLFQKRIETYLQARVPVQVDGKNIRLKVVQWKPGGKGREDGFDSSLATTLENSITLGGILPKHRNYLSTHVDMWMERDDAADTRVSFSLFHNAILLKQEVLKREMIWKFPLSRDSLSIMEKTIKSR